MLSERSGAARETRPRPLDLDDFPCGVIVVSTDGELRRVNRWLAIELGHDPAEFVPRHLDELLTKAGQVLYFSYLLPQLRLEQHVHESSLVFRRADGQTVEANVSGALQHEQGELRIVLVVTPKELSCLLPARLRRCQVRVRVRRQDPRPPARQAVTN